MGLHAFQSCEHLVGTLERRYGRSRHEFIQPLCFRICYRMGCIVMRGESTQHRTSPASSRSSFTARSSARYSLRAVFAADYHSVEYFGQGFPPRACWSAYNPEWQSDQGTIASRRIRSPSGLGELQLRSKVSDLPHRMSCRNALI